jgi:hypothetical protein
LSISTGTEFERRLTHRSIPAVLCHLGILADRREVLEAYRVA